MGRIVMKEAPDVDFYVIWSSIVDAPVYWGARAEIAARVESQVDNPAEERLARADATGTSAMPDPWVTHSHLPGAWDDSGFIYDQRGWLPRAKVFELARRLAVSSDPDVDDLLEPLGA